MGERIWGRTNSRCEVSGRWRMIKMSCDLQHRGFEYKASVNIYIRSLSHQRTALADLPGHWYLFCLHSRRAVLSRPTGTTQPFCYLRLGPQATPEAHLTAGSALWVSTHLEDSSDPHSHCYSQMDPAACLPLSPAMSTIVLTWAMH